MGKSQESFCTQECRYGYYGRNCRSQCDGYCKNSETCSNIGNCPSGCKDWYIPPRCKIEIDTARLYNRTLQLQLSNSNNILVTWFPEYYENLELRRHYGYRVQYRTQGNQITNNILVNNTDLEEESRSRVVITGLRYNTEYEVKVFPYRFDGSMVDEKSWHSSDSQMAHTPCINPGEPVITNYSPVSQWNGTVEYGFLMIKLSDQTGCDSLSEVEIHDNSTLLTKGSKPYSGQNLNISLQLNSTGIHKVHVWVENNKGLRTSSDEYIIITGVIQPKGEITWLYVGLAILGTVLMISVIVGLTYFFRRSKRGKAPIRGMQTGAGNQSPEVNPEPDAGQYEDIPLDIPDVITPHLYAEASRADYDDLYHRCTLNGTEEVHEGPAAFCRNCQRKTSTVQGQAAPGDESDPNTRLQYEEIPSEMTPVRFQAKNVSSKGYISMAGQQAQYEPLPGEAPVVYENRDITGPYAVVGESS